MSSPVRAPRTPQRNSEQSPRTRTPRQPTTPSSRSSRSSRAGTINGTPTRRGTAPSSTDTPLRWHGSRSAEVVPATSEGQSEGPSAIPSSPFRAPQTSPYNPGNDIDLSSPLNYGTPSSLSSIGGPRSASAHGTPIRLRTDIRVEKHVRQFNVGDTIPEEGVLPSSETDNAGGANLVIWGTDIVVSRCKEQFKRFLERFIDPEAENDELPQTLDLTEPLYMQKLEDISLLEEPYLNLNCAHLESFDENLYRQLINYPQAILPFFDMAVNEMFFAKYPNIVLNHQIEVRPFNVTKTKSMRNLNPEDIDQLVTVHGMVIRTSNILPEMREGFFKCIMCSYTCSVEIERGRISEPTLCTNCNNKFCFTLIHNRSHFSDKQMIKLQEAPDDMPASSTPHTVVLFAYNDRVDVVNPGDRVAVTGIYRAVPIQVNPRMSKVRSVYKTHIDVIHFRKQDSKRLYDVEEGKEHTFPPERVELLKLLSQKPNIYDRLANSIAPSIFENYDIKKGILLQLMGGTRKTHSSFGRSNFRSEINILLCGDPGTSKSQLLSFVYNLVPRSQYSSGKGSSAVGLTAYITKDPETRQTVLQTGALVLADNGICCIDEFDKMDDSTRSVLHEVMEQQTLSIAKTGIICQLNARTSILAAANPCESQWNVEKNIAENVKLPHTLLSRFDLIFIMLDPKSEVFDRQLARHLVSLYYENDGEPEDDFMDMSILRDYITYAKEHIRPTLGEEAQQKLIQCYVDMRKMGRGRGQITAYPRQLESLIRLSEAHAKVRFSNVVEVKDVDEAFRLYAEALKQSAVDPATGLIDINILATGKSDAYRSETRNLAKSISDMIKKKGKISTLNYLKFYMEVKESSQNFISRSLFEDAIRHLQDQNVLDVVGKTIRINRKMDLD